MNKRKKNKKEKLAILIFHINKDHSEVPWDIYYKMICNGEFIEMLESVNIRIVFSVQAEDVAFWAKENPDIIEQIKSNPNFSVLRGLYTHMMPSFFPGMLQKQISLGNKILEYYFGDKLSKIGCFPELDIIKDVQLLDEWEGFIALDGLKYAYEHRKGMSTRIPVQNKTILSLEDKIVIMAEPSLRDVYLKYFRGFATAEDFVQALENKIKTNENNLSVFLTDFEVPQVNNINGISRLDLWKELFLALKKSSIEFCHFDDIQKMLKKEAKTEIVIDHRDTTKWYHSVKIYEEIEKALALDLNTSIQDKLRITISDTFSALFWREVAKKNYIELPVNGSNDKVIIGPDLDRRIEAFNHFLCKVKGETPPNIKDKATKWFIKTLEKIKLP